jgi:hypothetical protein
VPPTAFELRDLIVASRSPTGGATVDKFALRAPPGGGRRMSESNEVQKWQIYLQDLSESEGLKHLVPDFWNKFFRSDRSIDWFLRHNEEKFGHIARFQIAAVLLNCEQEKISGDWYRALLNQIFPTKLDDFETDKLYVISFNYDRSFEAYFPGVLESQYGLSFEDAQWVFARIEIAHVYGQLGQVNEIPYGDTTAAAKAAAGIRLIRPDGENPTKERVQEMIRKCSYVNFIGFGFDEDNVRLLGPENFVNKRVYSTGRGISLRTRQQAMRELKVRFDKNTLELDAAQLFHTKNLFGPKLNSLACAKRSVVVRRPPFATRWNM